ncbi:MAG: carbon storage regulator [Phycisphaerae bacterium]|nr:carbon storage regulator [Phycisphaerae bacterium]
MLVLTRRPGEEIRLELPGLPPVIVHVLETHHGRVRLGVQAAPEIRVIRAELLADTHAA